VPFLSVIIPTYNASTTIQSCLESLSRQSWPRDRYEVVVVDDGSQDDTPGLVAGFPWVQFHRQPNSGPSTARNLGIGKARGTFLAFTDSDCLAAPDWLERLHRPFSDPSVLAVGGAQDCPADAAPFMRDVHAVLSMMGFLGGYTKQAQTLVETGHNPSCNAMYRREVLERAAGFRAGMFPGEDVDLDHRIRLLFPSGRILFAPDARVFHYRPRTVRAWWRMMVRYGFSNGHNVRLHGPFRLIHWVPWGMVAAACLWVLLAALAPLAASTGLATALLLGLLLVLGRSPGLPVRRILLRTWLLILMQVAFPLGFFTALWRLRRMKDGTV
jgi:glycosyltransferase involved in cell wall biosynthesis